MAEDPDSARLLARLAAIVGERNVLTDPAEQARYLEEWRGLYHGLTPAVIRPATADEVAAVLKVASETRTPVVPQSGNTGLVGGQVPDESGHELVVSLDRLDRIRAIDVEGGTMTVEAGTVLQRVQEAAEEAGLFFPLSLGSQGSCRIGGNISSNAGGTGVLSYGNTRSLVLGLEVALPSGELWNGLRALHKDNSGYDLKQLFIGAEGTLGIVTAAVLKLFAKPRGRSVAFVGLSAPRQALGLFQLARERTGSLLTGFELIGRTGLEFAVRHLPGARDPLAEAHSWYVLLEISSGRSEADAQELMEAVLSAAFQDGLLADATIASSGEQQAAFWELRHGLSEVQKHEGASVKHDVSVAVHLIPEFIERALAAVTATVPGCRPVPFGHMGDGNIHFNISQPVGAAPGGFMARAGALNDAVHGIIADLGGSIAAEHGIGRSKRELLRRVRAPLELDLMRRVKAAIDPLGIMNPGRVI
ncbi:FAD-binding oxidoreductase [Propylenella binzhouense]|uniref:FAD-binding oxidoreductase n=1 Tax=Propylenella binzhouense TaxID=2555902 RepID=A0A964T4T0_9HYPH|nr:FAD-binding oxidoreductase [Propylenella binzhouense]MYZ48160.1 FAD-binding oxidoreductase [Propylenella binzhouense]